MEAGDPTLGAVDKHADRLVRNRLRQHTGHHLLRFRRRKAQVAGADLDQAAMGTGGDQGQRRITTGGDHQVQLPGWAPQQLRDQGMDRGLFDHLVVV